MDARRLRSLRAVITDHRGAPNQIPHFFPHWDQNTGAWKCSNDPQGSSRTLRTGLNILMITQSYIYLSSNKLLWLFTFVFPCINTQQHIVLLCDAEKTELSCGARRPRMQFINLDDKDVSHRWSPCPKLGENRALMLHATNK